MSGASAGNRWLDGLPVYLTIFVTMAALVFQHVRSEYPIVDRWRYYVIVGAVSVFLCALIGYLVVQQVGARRPLLTMAVLCSMWLWPVPIWVAVASLNTRLDRGSAAEVSLRVLGQIRGKNGGLVGIRLESPDKSFPQVDGPISFVGLPPPAEGAILHGTYRPGAFGIRWISTLQRMTSTSGERMK